MALFDVGPLPKWMSEAPLPAESLLRGVQAGSEIRRNQIQTRRLIMDQEAQTVAMHNQARLQEGMVAFGQYMGSVEDWSDPRAEAGAMKVAAQYPWIVDTPAFQMGVQNFAKARTVKSASVMADWLAEHGKDDATVLNAPLPTDPIASMAAFKYKESAMQRKSSIERSLLPALMRGQTAESPLGKLQADRDKALKLYGSESEQVKQFDSAIQQTVSNKGRSIYVGMDDDGRPIFQMSEGGATPIGSPTVATESAAQRKLLKYEAATQLINDLQRNIKPEFLGARGVVGEYIADRTLPQLSALIPGIENVADPKRADFRSTLVAARESLLREISDDTRFSNTDREEIAKALPSTGIFESVPNAKQRLDTVRRILSQRGRTYSESIGLTPPIWSLSADEIKAQFKQGKLKEQEALDALERFH